MILEARNLKKRFKGMRANAVEDVCLSIGTGETVGVVGESGSGKSTLAKLILGLLPADSGEIFFKGADVKSFGVREWREFRKKIQVVFQHPALSLNPRMTVREILREPFLVHRPEGIFSVDEKLEELLISVELSGEFLGRLPRQMSGGECQRVAVARALSLGPELIICDEPVSSLDVIVQMQVLNLFLKLQKEKKISYLFISHDLRVVRHMSDRVVVMKDGRVVEKLIFKSACQ
ncbi:MAG: hypothetical protein A3C47_02310 [Omnitrophica bacterium RIFCSPHIGHO2_02_FULL_51_18]|nr:MAG: hypothetical protein A3C47_02310 [Omnitrophica bacterium RIFCSPHIGHO2_02_FULL_51_18]